jgi:hypothetical protein
MSVYLFNADGTGNDGIRHLIDAKKIKEYICTTFDSFDRQAHALLDVVGPEDYVILDTIGALLETTRGDIKLGKPTEFYWDRLDSLMAGEVFGATYDASRILIMRRLVNLRNRGARIITVAHERDQRDEGGLGSKTSKQRAPAVSPRLYSDLLGRSSDMFRLTILTEALTRKDGTVIVPAGKRQLQLRTSEDAVAKYQVRRDLSDKIPPFIYEPTWEKLTKVLGKTPSWLTIYGPPGSGKTTLAADMVESHTPPANITAQTEQKAA